MFSFLWLFYCFKYDCWIIRTGFRGTGALLGNALSWVMSLLIIGD